MDLTILNKVGLSAGEIKVYQALLTLGATSLNNIHEKTGIERRNIYDIINKLIERGFITYIDENKKRTYTLAPPKKILAYLEEKQATIETIKEDVKIILP